MPTQRTLPEPVEVRGLVQRPGVGFLSASSHDEPQHNGRRTGTSAERLIAPGVNPAQLLTASSWLSPKEQR